MSPVRVQMTDWTCFVSLSAQSPSRRSGGLFVAHTHEEEAVRALRGGFTASSSLLHQYAVLFGHPLSASQIYSQASLLNLTDLKSRYMINKIAFKKAFA